MWLTLNLEEMRTVVQPGLDLDHLRLWFGVPSTLLMLLLNFNWRYGSFKIRLQQRRPPEMDSEQSSQLCQEKHRKNDCLATSVSGLGRAPSQDSAGAHAQAASHREQEVLFLLILRGRPQATKTVETPLIGAP